MPYAYGTSANYSSNKNKSTSTNTGNNNRESYRTSTTYQKSVPPQRVKTAKKEYDDATGRSRLDNMKVKKVPAEVPFSTILNAGQKFRQKTLDKNVEYFKGLKSRGKATQYELTDEGYKEYIRDRSAGKIDAAGNVNINYGRDNEGNVQQKKVVGGQTILTKEKTAEETKVAEEKKEKEYDERITKKKGRRKNIRTGSLGVTQNSADYSLGKKSLLGQVV
tara:strand:- start:755 stop:1414 length:660 start_codon:yes stop_codon:yes gene_type:complete